MSKKGKKRVLNRKLKRTIRYTFATLCMITAITVAAIPAPKNEAADPLGISLPADTRKQDYSYPIKDERVGINGEPDSSSASYGDFNNVNAGSGYNLSKYHRAEDGTDSGQKDDTETFKEAYAVLKIDDNTYSLNWQYKYYEDNGGIVLCHYNDRFGLESITISNALPTGYYKVNNTELSAYFSGKKIELPAVDYLSTGTDTTDVENKLEKYANASDFAAWKKRCEDWKKAHDEYESLSPEDKVGVAEPILPVSDEKFVLDLEKIDPELRKQYYCQYVFAPDSFNPGDFNNFTLKECDDYSTGERTKVFLVKALEDADVSGRLIELDDQGFACNGKTDKYVSAIGDYAFQGVQNVSVLNMTGQIQGIGDYAFLNSFLQSVSFQNVKIIGNGAFKATHLKSVDLTGVQKIGAEAFAQNQELKTVQFAQNVNEIGAGAFYGCTVLESLDLTPMTSAFSVNKYAFYDCRSLRSIILPNGTTQPSMKSIGEGAFAVSRGMDVYDTDVILPSNLTELPDLLFAGRSKLKSVVFPDRYGAETVVNLPESMFVGCTGLEYVQFPKTCVNVMFGNSDDFCYEFYDVETEDFYVEGPGYKSGSTEPSKTRESFRGQKQLRQDKYVPFRFSGVDNEEYYEVQEGGYVLEAKIDKETQEGILSNISKPTNAVSGQDYSKLIIPNHVGNISIEVIASECIPAEMKPEIKTLEICDSVKRIETGAFADCKQLTDVTFNRNGNDNLIIEGDAFRTESPKLTFHGDIEEGYGPFEWAMAPENYAKTGTGIGGSMRVCYESSSPTYLKVIYDEKQDAVTLIDYPKYNKIDIEHKEEAEKKYYEIYKSSEYNDLRNEFCEAWANFMKNNEDSATPKPIEQFYSENEHLYGPWVNEQFVDPNNDEYKKDTKGWNYEEILGQENDSSGETGAVIDSLWTYIVSPIKVMAVESEYLPQAYFTRNPYSILEKYENDGPTSISLEELNWINACLYIEIPEAIKSIDIATFLEDSNNLGYFSKYVVDSDENNMYSQSDLTKDIVAGLFSGQYKDYNSSNEAEKVEKGNDYVIQIKMKGVTSLPDYAFDSCENLQLVEIGDACLEMGKIPFKNCSSLSSVSGNGKFFCENGIVYERSEGNNDLKIVECLPGRGGNVLLDSEVNIVSDPQLAYVTALENGAFYGCNLLSNVDFSEIASKASQNLKVIPDEAFRYCNNLREVSLPESVNSIQDYAFSKGNRDGSTSEIVYLLTVTIPGKEVFISTTAFNHESDVTLRSYEGSAAQEYANYYKPMKYVNIDDSFQVIFLDHDGTQIGETQYIEEGKNATPPADPVRSGYTFTGWSGSYNGITQDTILVAQYQAEGSGSGGSGGSGSGSGGSGGSESGGSSSSDGKYVLTVIGGTGSGSYAAGTNIIISANTPPKGKTFYNWTMSTTMSIVSSRSAATTVTMPASNATVTANYIDSGSSYLTVSTNEVQPLKKNTVSGNTTTNNKTNNVVTKTDGTKVSITKPGISNRDLAAAKVNGSTDNFIVKISESALATEEVQKALLAKYGSLDSIRYVAMDISLYDSTGTTQITDTTGLTVDVTIPIPDELIAYAGNNKAGAVSNGVLEDLTPKFTTIDGVACVTFRATHFSPYTIYVDVNNMSSGNLDETPKTGDGIAPKWVLSIGLAAISILLFMKKEKAPVRKKTA